MKLKLSLKNIFLAKEGFTALADADIPTKTAYWVEKTAVRLNRELELIERRRNALVQKMGVADGKGGILVQADKIDEFMGEFDKFLSETFVTIEFPMLTIADFPGTFKAKYLATLKPFMLKTPEDLEEEKREAEEAVKAAAETAQVQA